MPLEKILREYIKLRYLMLIRSQTVLLSGTTPIFHLNLQIRRHLLWWNTVELSLIHHDVTRPWHSAQQIISATFWISFIIIINAVIYETIDLCWIYGIEAILVLELI